MVSSSPRELERPALTRYRLLEPLQATELLVYIQLVTQVLPKLAEAAREFVHCSQMSSKAKRRPPLSLLLLRPFTRFRFSTSVPRPDSPFRPLCYSAVFCAVPLHSELREASSEPLQVSSAALPQPLQLSEEFHDLADLLTSPQDAAWCL